MERPAAFPRADHCGRESGGPSDGPRVEAQGRPMDRRFPEGQRRGGSGVCVADNRGVDRPALSPRHQQGGLRHGGIRHLPGASYTRPETGEWPPIRHLRRLHPYHRENTNRRIWTGTALCHRHHGGLLTYSGQKNEVTVRWVPAHYEIAGNEKTDDFAWAAAEGEAPRTRSPMSIGGRPACRI